MLFKWTGRLSLIFAMVLTISTMVLANVTPIETQVIGSGDSEKIRIKTNLMSYQFNVTNAELESAYIHFNTFDTQPTELIPGVITDQESLFVTVPEGASLPFRTSFDGTEDSLYTYDLQTLDDATVQVTFTKIVDGLEITKSYIVHNDPYYNIDFDLSLKNVSGGTLTLDDGYTLTLSGGIAQIGENNLQTAYLFNNKKSETIQPPPNLFGGLGYLGQGLAMFLKNETILTGSNTTVSPWIGQDTIGRRLLGVKVESLELENNESVSYDYLLYAGRWKYMLMDHSGLAEVAGKGPFSQFLVPTIQGLEWLYKTTGNYGWAIIVFTLITRLLMFPLLRQQFHSMAKMREVQPKMNRLKERYPSLNELRKRHSDMDAGELQVRARANRDKMQKKMMELYQKEGVNPLGGCLPSLIQMPFLILLWRTILYSAEAVHFSPGFLWMSDLSQPDPIYILVLLTTGLMILQTKTTPQMGAGAGQNQMLMYLMPVMMAVFLRDFPAGLWLYYFLTTGIQVLQQLFINREIAEKPKSPTIDEDDDEDDDEDPIPEAKAEAVEDASEDSGDDAETDTESDAEEAPKKNEAE